MMPHTHTEKACPNLNQYQQLALGELSEIEKESLLSHLESCDTCALKLKTLPEPDTLVEMLRQADTVDQETNHKAIAGLVERLSKLRPERISAGTRPQATATAAAAPNSENTIDQVPAAGGKKLTYEFLAPPQTEDELGRLGPYRVLEVLGTGGMGIVFRAEDPQLARLVALKAMLPGSMTSESARQRFLREARAAAAIKHDHIVSIYQVGEDRGVLYLAMELLDGETLDERLQREGKLPVVEVLRFGRQIALALAAAHKRGLIHRDIKPANVWLEAETQRVKILDFGLARTTGDEGHLTQQGAIVGTPAYMAPEQAKGKEVDHRCDLFSFGCVLYRMATGKAPFGGTDVVSSLISVATETPRPPEILVPGLPSALSKLIVSLLAKEAAKRPASAQAVAETLHHIAQVVAARPTPAKKRRSWWPAVGIAAAVAAVLIGLSAGGVFRVRTPDGTIVIDVNEPGSEILVDGQEATVTWDQGRKKAVVRIKPGTRKVEVKVMKEGFGIVSELVEIEEGGRTIFTAKLDPNRPVNPKVSPVSASSASVALESLRRDQIAPEALKLAGNGDASKAPAGLVGLLGEAAPVQAGQVCSLAFSPDGRWLASASYDTTILVRDVATGRVHRFLNGHASPGMRVHTIVSVAFSKDSRTLVSAGQDGTVKLWPMDKLAEPHTLQPKLDAIWGMAVSADGRFLAAGGTNGRIHLWKWGQWDSPQEITPEGHKTGMACLAFSPDGESLAVGRVEDKSDVPIRIYNTSDGKVVLSVKADANKGLLPMGITFSRDGKHFACMVSGWKAGVWDAASGKSVADFPAGQYGSVAFSQDGKSLAVAGRWHVVLYNLASKKQERVLAGGHLHCFPVAFSFDGKLLAGGFSTGTVHVWDTTSWKEKYLERGHLHYVRGLTISGDGGTVLSVGDDDTLRRWDLAKPGANQILHQFLADDYYTGPTPQGCATIAQSPNGRSFALVVRGDGYTAGPPLLSVWDSATKKTRWSLPLAPGSIAYSPDGKTLAGTCEDRTVRLWDAEQGGELHRFDLLGLSSGLAFSKDGKLLAVVSQEKEGWVKVWNVASGAEIHSWQDAAMTAAVFRPDSQVLAIGHADGAISLWDLAEGKKKRTLKGHSAKIQMLKFTPDGKTLLSSGHDGTIRVWNPEFERAQQVIPIGSPNQRVVLDLDPSGQYLFAAGHAPVIYVLRLLRGDKQDSLEKQE